MKKKWIAIILILVTAFSAGCSSKGNDGKTSGGNTGGSEMTTLNIWSSGDELERYVEGFNKQYPNIKVNITVVPNDDFLAKIGPTLSSGKDAPDLFTGESNYVKYLLKTDYWDDLSQAPYNFDNTKAGLWDFVVEAGTDQDGKIKALSWQASPGGIIYRSDMAEEYLNVSTSEEFSALISSNEKMLEIAEQLKKNDIKMFASWQDLLNMFFSNRTSPWVVEDQLVIDESIEEFMDMAKTIYENGYDLNVDPWAPEWTAAVESDDVFSYVLPTWGYQFVVKPGADTTSGNWALAETPNSYIKGGTWLGIYKGSDNKEDAWKFLEYVTCNAEAQEDYAKEYGEYMSLKSVDEKLAGEEGDEVLGGQNLYEFYNKEMAKGVKDLMTEYDSAINDSLLSATKTYIRGTFSKEEAIQQIKEDVKSAYPDLTVD